MGKMAEHYNYNNYKIQTKKRLCYERLKGVIIIVQSVLEVNCNFYCNIDKKYSFPYLYMMYNVHFEKILKQVEDESTRRTFYQHPNLINFDSFLNQDKDWYVP